MTTIPTILPTLNICHPERSLAVSNANRQTQSKDPYHADAAADVTGNFRVEIRFYDESGSFRIQPRIGERMQPRARAVGRERKLNKPRRGETNARRPRTAERT